jgi:hypothetical protein
VRNRLTSGESIIHSDIEGVDTESGHQVFTDLADHLPDGVLTRLESKRVVPSSNCNRREWQDAELCQT